MQGVPKISSSVLTPWQSSLTPSSHRARMLAWKRGQEVQCRRATWLWQQGGGHWVKGAAPLPLAQPATPSLEIVIGGIKRCTTPRQASGQQACERLYYTAFCCLCTAWWHSLVRHSTGYDTFARPAENRDCCNTKKAASSASLAVVQLSWAKRVKQSHKSSIQLLAHGPAALAPGHALTSKGHLAQGGDDASVADVMAGTDAASCNEGLGHCPHALQCVWAYIRAHITQLGVCLHSGASCEHCVGQKGARQVRHPHTGHAQEAALFAETWGNANAAPPLAVIAVICAGQAHPGCLACIYFIRGHSLPQLLRLQHHLHTPGPWLSRPGGGGRLPSPHGWAHPQSPASDPAWPPAQWQHAQQLLLSQAAKSRKSFKVWEPFLPRSWLDRALRPSLPHALRRRQAWLWQEALSASWN